MHFLSLTSSSETPAAVVWLKRQIVKSCSARLASIHCVCVCVYVHVCLWERDVLHEWRPPATKTSLFQPEPLFVFFYHCHYCHYFDFVSGVF